MKTTKIIHWMAALTLALPVAARAADEPSRAPQAPPLISHDDLQSRLNEPHLRLLDVRSRENYDKGHIPGAVWVDVKALLELVKPDALTNQETWSRGLAPLAIDNDAEVYVYDDDRQHIAGRVWWLLSYAGAPRVGLVDGGFPLWERDRRPVNSEVRTVQPVAFATHFHAKRLASREEVRSAIREDKVQIIDARSEAEYRGEKKPQNGGRAGHIPTARLLDLYELVDADGRFLGADAQRQKLARAGIASDREIIVYSQGGSRSGGVVFALRRLGIPARHYFAGLSDWSSDPSAPIVEGNEAGRPAE